MFGTKAKIKSIEVPPLPDPKAGFSLYNIGNYTGNLVNGRNASDWPNNLGNNESMSTWHNQFGTTDIAGSSGRRPRISKSNGNPWKIGGVYYSLYLGTGGNNNYIRIDNSALIPQSLKSNYCISFVLGAFGPGTVPIFDLSHSENASEQRIRMSTNASNLDTSITIQDGTNTHSLTVTSAANPLKFDIHCNSNYINIYLDNVKVLNNFNISSWLSPANLFNRLHFKDDSNSNTVQLVEYIYWNADVLLNQSQIYSEREARFGVAV